MNGLGSAVDILGFVYMSLVYISVSSLDPQLAVVIHEITTICVARRAAASVALTDALPSQHVLDSFLTDLFCTFPSNLYFLSFLIP